MSAVALAVGLTGTAVAHVTYKTFVARGRRLVLLLAAMGLFGLAQLGFFVALTGLDVGIVYMSTAFTHALVLALSKFVLGEEVGRHHLVAIALVTIGLVLYAG